MDINMNPGVLSDKLHELIVQELDFKDSEVNRYLDNQALNLILTTLTLERRLEYYELLGNDDFDSAKELVLKDIPDFHKRLLVKVKEKFQKIL